MNNEKQTKPIEVFAGTAMESGMVRNLLEHADIEAFLKDEFIGSMMPWHAAPGGVGAVKVFVSVEDLEMAKQIVAEFQNNLNK